MENPVEIVENSGAFFHGGKLRFSPDPRKIPQNPFPSFSTKLIKKANDFFLPARIICQKIKSTDRDTIRESKELLSLPEPPPSARKDAFKSPEKALVKNMKKDLSEKFDTRFPKDETDAVTGETPHTAAEDTAAEDVLHARVSKAVIRRLPRYYRYLRELIREGKSRVSSGELSELMNVTASQIRQDLNCFGGFGQQGYGYNVNYLYTKIGELLGVSAGLRAGLDSQGRLEDHWTAYALGGGGLVSPEALIAPVEAVTARDVCRAAEGITLDTVYQLCGEGE